MTKTSRRSFLKAAALTGAGLLVAGQQTFAQSPLPSRNLLNNRPRGGMSITTSEFGTTADGETIEIYKLDNGRGITVEVLSRGGVMHSVNVPDRNGRTVNVSANFETLAEYERHRNFFGALVGRYGNRIAGARFTLDGVEYTLAANNGPNSLHGGRKGFDTVIWKVQPIRQRDSVGLRLDYTSKDGEEGFPGNLDVTVIYRLDNRNRWTMDYTARTDKPTVVNLTNHAYWNLAGFSTNILEQVMTLNANYVLPTDDTLIPTGEFQPVAGTPFDFRTPRKFGERIHEIEGAHFGGGYDHCFVLNQRRPRQMTFCALVYEPNSGRTMRIDTTEPGVQLFTGNYWNGRLQAFGHTYERFGAFCLETQHFPDSPNQPAFPSTVLRPGEVYRTTTVHTFGVR